MGEKEQCLIHISDFFDVSPAVREYRKVIDSQERQQILAWYERPGWKDFMYRIASRLRQEWELSPEPDTQAAITKVFIDTNTNNWKRSVDWKDLILEFLNSEDAKDSLAEVAKNLHRQWKQGQLVAQELIGGYTGIRGELIGAMSGIMGTVGIRKDQSPNEKIARLMDPYFESSEAPKIGAEMCREQGIPIEAGVRWGVKFGFTKRNTISLIKEKDENRRGEILQWLKDDSRTEQALQTLASNL